MSASDKKKLRKEEKLEKLTQRQLQEQKSNKKNKVISIAFIAGLALILIAAIVITVINVCNSTGIVGKTTTVAKIGDHKLSLTDFNYYYVDAVTELKDSWYTTAETYTQYGMSEEEALSMLTGGMDLSKPISQTTDPQTGKNFGELMVETALSNAQRDYMLCDAAKAAGFTLPAEEQAEIDAIGTTLEQYATWTNYPDVNTFLREANGYGPYATQKSYIAYKERQALANAYYAYYVENITYTDAEYRAYEGDAPEDYNSYSYAYYTVEIKDFLEHTETSDDTAKKTADNATEEETKETTTEVTYTDEEKEAARTKAEQIANELIVATSVEEFDENIGKQFSPEFFTEEEEEVENPTEEQPEAEDNKSEAADEATDEHEGHDHAEEEATEATEPETSIKSSDVLHTSSKTDFREWMGKAETVTGSATVIPAKTNTENPDEITGYYAVYLFAKSENTKPNVDVRHLLVGVEETATEEEWAEGLKTAEKLLADWKAGEATEDSFATMVTEHTDDPGSTETGGLYEDIHETSSYVEPFLAWCVDDARTVGETGIVKTEYGYHIMYFVGREEVSYRDQMIGDKLRAADAEVWITEQTKTCPIVRKNTKKIDVDMIPLTYGYI